MLMEDLFSVLHKYVKYLETQRNVTNQNHKSLSPVNKKDLADFVYIYGPYVGIVPEAAVRKYADIIAKMNTTEAWVPVYLGDFGQEHSE